VSRVRSVPVSAWNVQEGDISPSGTAVVSVHRDPSRGKVRIGFRNGQELTLSGERRVVIVWPRPAAGRFHNGAERARALLRRPR
jgi:hypothetical protein